MFTQNIDSIFSFLPARQLKWKKMDFSCAYLQFSPIHEQVSWGIGLGLGTTHIWQLLSRTFHYD